jgi:restriction endonuclease S subunit
VTIGEIAKVGAGQGAPQDPGAFSSTGHPFVRAGSLDILCLGENIQSLERITEAGARQHRMKLYPKGTVVFAKSGMSATMNRVFVLPESAYIVSHLATLEVKPHVSSFFLRYFWEHYRPARLIQDPAYPSINLEAISRVEIDLPPLSEQKRIAAILAKADRLRRLRRTARDLSDTYLQSVFLEMFGDPVSNPMGWNIHRLGKHLTFVTSGSRGWAQYYSSSGARFIRSLDVQMNRISNSDAVFVVPPAGAEAERTRVQPRDVLLTITGSRIGRVTYVPSSMGEAYISQHVAILRLDGLLRPDFVSMFLSHPRGGQLQIARLQYGQTKPGLNFEQIRSFEIPCPPLQKQQEFTQIIHKFERLRAQQREAERQAEHLFQALLHRAFRGELEDPKGLGDP